MFLQVLQGKKSDKFSIYPCTVARAIDIYTYLCINIFMLKSIYISEDLHKELKIYAAKHGNSISNLVENAIGNLINKKAIAEKNPNNEKSKESVLSENKGGLTKSRGELNAEDYI